MSSVLIFRDLILKRTETFIQAHAESLRDFRPIIAGLRKTEPSLPVRPAVLLTKAQGELAKAIAMTYRITGFAPAFHRAIEVRDPDIMHVHFATDATAALSIQSHLQVPLIVSLHGSDVAIEDAVFRQTVFGRCYLARRGKMILRVSKFLCASEAVLGTAINRGFPERKLLVHYVGVDCDKFRFVPDFMEERDRNIVMFVGRLVPVKGCEYLIQALNVVRRDNPSVQLVVIGDGPLRKELEGLAARLHVNAKFLGELPASEVREWLGKARILCAPSVTTLEGQKEGFGLVLIEAQAVGTPVVSSKSGGIVEAVVDGETGLLAKEGDVMGLATQIRRLLSDQSIWNLLSSKGRRRVESLFNLHQQTKRLEDIYRSTIQEWVKR